MAATGSEAISLAQLLLYKNAVDTALDAKMSAPSSTGTSGQVLTTDGAGTYSWTTVSAGTTYTGSNGVDVTGSVIIGIDAAAGTKGVVEFATDTDFNEYMGLS